MKRHPGGRVTGLLLLTLSGFVLFVSPAAGDKPKESDFPVDFLVRTSSTVPGYGGTMSLENDRKVYYVETAACLAHCYVFQPGTHMHGRFRRGTIDLFFTDDKQNPKIGHYKINQTVLLPAK